MSWAAAQRRFITWMAALAFFGTALLPSISQAAHALAGVADAVEVCTSSGSKWVSTNNLKAIDTAPVDPTAHAADHCPCCLLHTPVWTAAHTPAFADWPAAGAAAPSAATVPWPVTTFAWRAAPSRAPPSALV